MRDSQRQRIYDAEDAIHGENIPDIQDIQRYVDRIAKKLHISPIRVGDGRRRTHAGGNANGIKLPRWSRYEGLILHEVAHTLTLRQHSRAATHGPEYARNFLLLVRRVMGKDAAKFLKTSFQLHRVRVSRNKKDAIYFTPKPQQRRRNRQSLLEAAKHQ